MCNTDNKNFLFWNKNTLGSVTSENWLKSMICALWFQPLSVDVEESCHCALQWRAPQPVLGNRNVWSPWPEVYRRPRALQSHAILLPFVNVCSLEAVLQPSALECAPKRVLWRRGHFLSRLSFLAHFLPSCCTSYILSYGMRLIDKSSTSI